MTIESATRMLEYRSQFPALRREINGRPAVFLDGPAGTQVPQRVIDAIGHYLSSHNANHGGTFLTSIESDRALQEAHQAYADFVGSSDGAEISFGQNMTSLTFAMSRAIARRWQAGDEIIVTRLDHDANVTPWVMAAQDRGVTVRYVDIKPDDCTLDVDDFASKLNSRTRLVAVGAASNASGTINPIEHLTTLAHDVGAWVYVDAVHLGPHRLIDVNRWGCDFVAFSSYKFFGPHLGILWGKRQLLETLDAYKVRPASNELPDKWMTGTQSHESIMGAMEAVDYLADIGRDAQGDLTLSRREALRSAFDEITIYEQELCRRLLRGLSEIPGIRIWGIADENRLHERCATISITHDRVATSRLAEALGEVGIFVWAGNYYALQLTEALQLEPEGMVRIGLLHYNTQEEVDRLLDAIQQITAAG